MIRAMNEDKAFGVNFKYALFAIAGILRFRLADPWALVAEQSELARELIDVLSDVHNTISGMGGRVRNGQEKLETVRDLIEILSGTGGRRDILTVIDQMSDV